MSNKYYVDSVIYYIIRHIHIKRDWNLIELRITYHSHDELLKLLEATLLSSRQS